MAEAIQPEVRYVVMSEAADRHHVVLLPSRVSRGWVQVVGTFSNRLRAECYAEVETDIQDSNEDILGGELAVRPSSPEPESRLRRLRDALRMLDQSESTRIEPAPVNHGPVETSASQRGMAQPSSGEVHGRTSEPTSPTIPATVASKVEKAVALAAPRLTTPTAAAARGLPPNVYAKGGRFIAKVNAVQNSKSHLGSFATPVEAAAAVAAYKARTAEIAAAAPAPTPVPPAAPAPELPAGPSPGAKDEAPASSPLRGVSSLDLSAPASSEAAPALSGLERRRKVLDYYATHDVSIGALADRFGCSKTTALNWIEGGRDSGLAAVLKGDALRGKAPRQEPAPAPRDDDRPLPKTGAASPKQFIPSPIPDRPRVPGSIALVPVGDIAIDESAHVVAGPGGEWVTHATCVSILKRLALLKTGQYLDIPSLAEGASISRGRLAEGLPRWKSELASIGIELGQVGENLYLKRAEVAA